LQRVVVDRQRCTSTDDSKQIFDVNDILEWILIDQLTCVLAQISTSSKVNSLVRVDRRLLFSLFLLEIFEMLPSENNVGRVLIVNDVKTLIG
jgi:hypothetical protein